MTIFVGAFEVNSVFHRTLTIIATSSIVITAVYILRLIGKILYGQVQSKASAIELTDATWDEKISLFVLVVAIAGMGLIPFGINRLISDSVLPFIASISLS